jgi:hypothetical protein
MSTSGRIRKLTEIKEEMENVYTPIKLVLKYARDET